jgi:hypothetical protein
MHTGECKGGLDDDGGGGAAAENDVAVFVCSLLLIGLLQLLLLLLLRVCCLRLLYSWGPLGLQVVAFAIDLSKLAAADDKSKGRIASHGVVVLCFSGFS